MTKVLTTFLAVGVIAAGLGLGVLAQSAATNTRTFDELFVQAAASGNALEIETSRLAGDRSSSASIKSFAALMVTMHTKVQQDLNAAASRNAPATNGGGSSTGTSGSSAGKPNSTQSGTGATSPGGPTNPQGNIGTGNGNIGSNTSTTQASGGGASFVALLSPGEQLRGTYLSTLKGVQFDRAYITEQVNAHEGAIVVYRLAAQRLKDGNLKAFAAKSLPMIQAHYSQIVAIAKTIK